MMPASGAGGRRFKSDQPHVDVYILSSPIAYNKKELLKQPSPEEKNHDVTNPGANSRFSSGVSAKTFTMTKNKAAHLLINVTDATELRSRKFVTICYLLLLPEFGKNLFFKSNWFYFLIQNFLEY